MVYVWLAEAFEAGAYANVLHRAMALSGISVVRETNVPALICYVTTSESPHLSALLFSPPFLHLSGLLIRM